MRRFGPYLTIMFFGCVSLAGCANHPESAKAQSTASAKTVEPTMTEPAQDLDSSIRQAQALRLAGKYQEAIHNLSQLMMVASDDVRVLREYGKTLAVMGRASEALNFLTRAQQLGPSDWSTYSAMGVAYDEVGDTAAAKVAYEHALKLNPGEPSVLNNYALSRMLAKDPLEAQKLVQQLKSSALAKDPMILRNIAMIDRLAPAPNSNALSALAASSGNKATTQLAPTNPATSEGEAVRKDAAAISVLTKPTNQDASLKPLSSNAISVPAQPSMHGTNIVPSGVVMQPVPLDPLAGPVHVAQRPPHNTILAQTDPALPSASSGHDNGLSSSPAKKRSTSTKLALKSADAKSPAGAQAPLSAGTANSLQDSIPSLRMSASAY